MAAPPESADSGRALVGGQTQEDLPSGAGADSHLFHASWFLPMVLRSLHARRRQKAGHQRRGRRPLLPRPRRQDQQRAEAEQLPAVAAGVLGARSSLTSCGLILGRTSTSTSGALRSYYRSREPQKAPLLNGNDIFSVKQY
ncbi:hypothetical protein C2845_PM04G24160 [Panicum miliaceum]|uniref:Uncharacterized protein n=1 Tax=Panicum miliaceum TaxID=4540 RepID=A0A3L6QR49_PANMI|nr:hypothetical protein C2845_PM04G24160 [Panicum miliaceum]